MEALTIGLLGTGIPAIMRVKCPSMATILGSITTWGSGKVLNKVPVYDRWGGALGMSCLFFHGKIWSFFIYLIVCWNMGSVSQSRWMNTISYQYEQVVCVILSPWVVTNLPLPQQSKSFRLILPRTIMAMTMRKSGKSLQFLETWGRFSIENSSQTFIVCEQCDFVTAIEATI